MDNDKCMLSRTGKKYKCMSKHMKTDGAQFCSTRTRAKIAKKNSNNSQQGHQTIAMLHHHCDTPRNGDRTSKLPPQSQNQSHNKMRQKIEILIQNQNTRKDHIHAKRHMHEHNLNTFKQPAKQNSNQQHQNNKNVVKPGIIKHQNTTEIWAKTRHQKTHKSK